METIFEILKSQPVLSICLGFVLAVIAMFLFKNEIKEYIKKKYNLLELQEVESLLTEKIGGKRTYFFMKELKNRHESGIIKPKANQEEP